MALDGVLIITEAGLLFIPVGSPVLNTALFVLSLLVVFSKKGAFFYLKRKTQPV